MRPVSDEFLDTIHGSHTATFRAKVVTNFPTGTNPTGTEIPILSGQVVLDANSDVRATLDMETDGNGMWPTTAASLLAPYGNEIFIERGVELAGGVREWVSQGYFRIETPEQDDAPNGPIRIAGKDRMAGLIEARLLAPVQFMAGTALGDIFDELVTEVYPTAVIEWDDATDLQVLARDQVAQQERFEFLRDLAAAYGKVMYWDYRGVLVITSPPDPTSPVFEVSAGANGVLVKLSRQLSREGVFNAVVATGEAADTQAPVRAVAVDNNPDSPTYFYGANTSGRTFGQVPRFFSSPFITTLAQAQSAATTLLTQQLGLPYSVDFTAVPNPALEPLDPVRTKYSVSIPSEIHIIERLTIPLTASSALVASTREQSDVIVGVS